MGGAVVAKCVFNVAIKGPPWEGCILIPNESRRKERHLEQ